MTAAKNVYALMLALVIVLSGCFGNTADDADATDDGSTTIVNNFYNNTTTTVIQDIPEMIAIGGINAHPGPYTGNQIPSKVATINTTAGQMLQIHETSNKVGSITVYTNCSGGEEFSMHSLDYSTSYQYRPVNAPGSFTDCTHEVNDVAYSAGDHGWSFVYSIVPVTVG